jgi:predicted metal-binding protein
VSVGIVAASSLIVSAASAPRVNSIARMIPWRSCVNNSLEGAVALSTGATRVTLSESEADIADREIATDAAATIYVCITCRRPGDPDDAARPGAALAAQTLQAAQGSGVSVRRVRCLANCNRGCSAAVRRTGAWTYVFGDLDAARDAVALVEGARLFARASDGVMPWRGRPEVLKRGLIARVPPLDFMEEVE